MKMDDMNGQEIVLRFTKDEMEELTKWMQLAEALPLHECELPSWTYYFMALSGTMRVMREEKLRGSLAEQISQALMLDSDSFLLWNMPTSRKMLKAIQEIAEKREKDNIEQINAS